ncbi:hypothetical protein ER308_07335 [Egibacter rhizosphaerae]|uniref:Uncharacterized protein n=1 Tax=Egibacter rhizosphaerae TaxID=1670831 RepID=A0A411YDU6_9ACTN|nr:hypothetical protein [Egibacter rhizosphaerae]QBI19378.1 hypothetical protein ER308_07335 [Egibacter rhizosphaerae]
MTAPDDAVENARWFEDFHRDRAARLERHLRALLEMDDPQCRYDHNGRCQAHYVESPCRVAAARSELGDDGGDD